MSNVLSDEKKLVLGLYRTRARAPCSPHHPSVDAHIRYSA